MTVCESWPATASPEAMLDELRGKTSERKLRLFACACCRRIWHLLSDERSRRAVEVAERFADGLASAAELAEAARAAVAAARDAGRRRSINDQAADAAAHACFAGYSEPEENAHFVAFNTAYDCAGAVGYAAHRRASEAPDAAYETAIREEEAEQCALLRDLFGGPFRPVDPSWLRWKGAVVELARCIYEEGAFERLPFLADALEEAGCTDANVLEHLRGPGPHARGCHILDAIIGRE